MTKPGFCGTTCEDDTDLSSFQTADDRSLLRPIRVAQANLSCPLYPAATGYVAVGRNIARDRMDTQESCAPRLSARPPRTRAGSGRRHDQQAFISAIFYLCNRNRADCSSVSGDDEKRGAARCTFATTFTSAAGQGRLRGLPSCLARE